MKILGVIPARYASTRFPGKPLAMIQGSTMINRVYNQVLKAEKIDRVVVATDDERIFDHVKEFGGQAIMTCKGHENGTSRCAEAVEILEKENPGFRFDVVINIQGDEPFIDPFQIDKVAAIFEKNKTVQIGTLIKPIGNPKDLFNPNVVKAVPGKNRNVLYFSRQAIPFLRGVPEEKWLERAAYYKHIGIYGYRVDILGKLVRLHPGKLEKAEKLEQLRWLENGYSVKAEITDFESISVDTPEDLSKINNNR
ncbi:MAG: 3-deoxy-manno-octulosonate cytidylyltransferase [Chlorobi bacterium]|nr:3-deoxy-manno-octulosonate cytidylyltransferase [Chlorobiota bacterium]